MADRALPVRCSHAHATPAADPVAAASADGAQVPELSQRPLAAGAGPLAVLPGKALRAPSSKLLELTFHPPEGKMEGITHFVNHHFYFINQKTCSVKVRLMICKVLIILTLYFDIQIIEYTDTRYKRDRIEVAFGN